MYKVIDGMFLKRPQYELPIDYTIHTALEELTKVSTDTVGDFFKTYALLKIYTIQLSKKRRNNVIKYTKFNIVEMLKYETRGSKLAAIIYSRHRPSPIQLMTFLNQLVTSTNDEEFDKILKDCKPSLTNTKSPQNVDLQIQYDFIKSLLILSAMCSDNLLSRTAYVWNRELYTFALNELLLLRDIAIERFQYMSRPLVGEYVQQLVSKPEQNLKIDQLEEQLINNPETIIDKMWSELSQLRKRNGIKYQKFVDDKNYTFCATSKSSPVWLMEQLGEFIVFKSNSTVYDVESENGKSLMHLPWEERLAKVSNRCLTVNLFENIGKVLNQHLSTYTIRAVCESRNSINGEPLYLAQQLQRTRSNTTPNGTYLFARPISQPNGSSTSSVNYNNETMISDESNDANGPISRKRSIEEEEEDDDNKSSKRKHHNDDEKSVNEEE